MRTATFLFFSLLFLATISFAAEPPSRDEVQAALAKASSFFQGEVASGGGYVYAYSGDLTLREGEGNCADMGGGFVADFAGTLAGVLLILFPGGAAFSSFWYSASICSTREPTMKP
jgi:hypothetical protein